jgi:hypothetical protein
MQGGGKRRGRERIKQASVGAFVSYNVGVQDNAAQLRLKAEACRRLADLTEDAERKTIWLVRADHWERLAAKAEQSQQHRSVKKADTSLPRLLACAGGELGRRRARGVNCVAGAA